MGEMYRHIRSLRETNDELSHQLWLIPLDASERGEWQEWRRTEDFTQADAEKLENGLRVMKSMGMSQRK